MASSSSSGNQRRRPLTKRQPLSRRNSSFLGSLKSLVTAPLAWFASTDDFEDSKDFQGKRRRLAGVPKEPIASDEDRSPRNKRMRVDSPPRDISHSEVHGYLDPPSSVFQHRQSSPLIQPTSTRSFSATQSYDLINNNNLRASTLTRTMSIDPPPRPAMASDPLHRDTLMDTASSMRPLSRDLSMPPLSGRPSFLMRTSMTPQPAREVSEPPPLNMLHSRPTFLHPPVAESKQNVLTKSSSTTLGSLADSVRRHRSPSRQHSSLLFGEIQRPRPETMIEKALYELDIYKTPLVPTRLRSSNMTSAASSSSMFKSRRASNLVLMSNDNPSNRLGRKVSENKEAPLVNETKPYAGEGGMKKFLAKRKQEVDEENHQTTIHDDQILNDKQTSSGKPVNSLESSLSAPSKVHQVSNGPHNTAQSQSSLRVGRTRTRNHIARPSRPQKMKFSAAFDEDAMDDGDELDEEAAQKKKELEDLEEAAKHVPVFNIPAGFSFAKDTKPAEIDLSTAKEPPIKALPFSFSNPAPTLENQNQEPAQPTSFFPSLGLQAPIGSTPTLTQAIPASLPSLPQAPETENPAPAPLPAPSTVPPTIPAATGMPNFFANSPALLKPTVMPTLSKVPNFFSNSAALSKPLDLPPTKPLTFNAPSTLPVQDAENPFWEGGQRNAAGPASTDASSGFSFSAKESEPLGNNTATEAHAAADLVSSGKQSTEDVSTPTQSTPLGAAPSATPFSFPKAVEASSVASVEVTKSSSIFGNASATATMFGVPPASALFSEPPKAAITPTIPAVSVPSAEPPKTTSTPSFTFGPPATDIVPSLEATEAPKSSFGSTGGLSFGMNGKVTGQRSASSPFSFASTSSAKEEKKPSSPFSFGNAASTETGQKTQSTAFSFGNSNTDSATQAEQKPAGNMFSFGSMASKEVAAKPASNPFSFGAAPSTPPPAEMTRSASFTFGTTAPSAPAPSLAFSFSGGGDSGGNASTKPFTFGQPATTTRPSTPPRQEVEVSMDESPTRDMQQQNIKLADRPTIGGSGFSFGNSASTSNFGTQSTASAPFSFGTSSSTTNTFGKPAESSPFGFGQAATTSTAFSFGQTKPDIEPPRPNTAGSFSFGATSTTAPTVFPFGGPGNNSTGSTFGQSQAGSAPGSPSTFNQQSSPFSFGAPLPPVNTGFSFGSQPASPAGVNNLSLPQPVTPGGFGNTAATSGFGQAQQPSSPFNAPTSTAPATGGALFTIGAAPTASPAANRAIRKLPNRRGGAKR
ncbi:hypothetical protein H0H92_005452 [Tricholoma furcatifolium]|nr:hypothetical protein H0H92_005452 [Tricholoma furcatifolium]